MKRVGLFVQARLNSERLPGKMLKTIYEDKTILYMCLQAVNGWYYDEKVLLVPYGETKYFKEIADEFDFPIIEGPEDDLLGRFIKGIEHFPNVELVQRVCADKVIFAKFHQHEALLDAEECFCDLTHYADDPIRAVTAGIYKASALFLAHLFYPWGKGSVWNKHREHIKPLFFKGAPGFWNVNTISISDKVKRVPVDISIDTEEDLEKIRNIFSDFYTGEPLDFWDMVHWFDENKKI